MFVPPPTNIPHRWRAVQRTNRFFRNALLAREYRFVAANNVGLDFAIILAENSRITNWHLNTKGKQRKRLNQSWKDNPAWVSSAWQAAKKYSSGIQFGEDSMLLSKFSTLTAHSFVDVYPIRLFLLVGGEWVACRSCRQSATNVANVRQFCRSDKTVDCRGIPWLDKISHIVSK